MGNSIKFDGYFDFAFERNFMAKARATLKDVDFDTCVGTGLSGTIGATILARGMRKNLAIVRKPDDNSTHSSRTLEGVMGERWIFVDDFVSLGRTRRRVLEAVERGMVFWNRARNSMRDTCQSYLDTKGYIPSYINGGDMAPWRPEFVTTHVGSYLYQYEGHFERPWEYDSTE